MGLRSFVSAAVLGCVATANEAKDKTQKKLPHILFVLIDDFGWADASWHREPSFRETEMPHMQALLDEGVELDRNYVHKFCSPTRCAIQSGRNPIHVNAQNVAMTRFDPQNPRTGISGIPLNMTGFAQRLGEAGYSHRTFAGKSDIGMAYYKQTPMGRGYTDALFYFNHDNDYWSFGKDPDDGGCRLPNSQAVARDLYGTNPDGSHGPQYHLSTPSNCWGRPTGTEGGAVYPDNMTGCVYEEDLFTNFTIGHILSHDESQGPLLAFHAAHSIHAPLEVVPDAYDRFEFVDDERRRKYAAMVYNVDRAIGRIVDALKVKNMYKDTLLVLSADNGGPIYLGGGANNHPLKGGKASNWEGGIRVNGFVSGGWLPETMRGKKLDGLITGWDWYATFVEGIAGLDPTDAEAAAEGGLPAIDSVNQWPYLSGQTTTPPRSDIPFGTSKDPEDTWCTGKNEIEVHTLIQVDNKSGHLFKLMVGAEHFAIWTGPQYPNATSKNPDLLEDCGFESGCLFDLTVDPSEHTNVAAQYAEVLADMRASLEGHNKTVWAPYRPNNLEMACAAITTRYRDPENDFAWWGPFAEDLSEHIV